MLQGNDILLSSMRDIIPMRYNYIGICISYSTYMQYARHPIEIIMIYAKQMYQWYNTEDIPQI